MPVLRKPNTVTGVMPDESPEIVTRVPQGLSSAEARRRLADNGPHATPDSAVHPVRRALGKFIAPVPCLLEAVIALQLLLGEYVEASVIAVLLVFNAVVALIHAGRARATIETLKSRLPLWAAVRRDGSWINLPASELVPGDIIKLSLGSIVAADYFGAIAITTFPIADNSNSMA